MYQPQRGIIIHDVGGSGPYLKMPTGRTSAEAWARRMVVHFFEKCKKSLLEGDITEMTHEDLEKTIYLMALLHPLILRGQIDTWDISRIIGDGMGSVNAITLSDAIHEIDALTKVQ